MPLTEIFIIIKKTTAINNNYGLLHPLILGVFYGLIYFAAAYGILGLFGVKKETRFTIAALPLIIVAILWIVWAIFWSIWAGLMILGLLVFAAIIVWIIRKI